MDFERLLILVENDIWFASGIVNTFGIRVNVEILFRILTDFAKLAKNKGLWNFLGWLPTSTSVRKLIIPYNEVIYLEVAYQDLNSRFSKSKYTMREYE